MAFSDSLLESFTLRDSLTSFCKVCPICNGKSCAGQVPDMGGLGSGSSFTNNIEALAKIKFNMRLIHDVTEPDTSVTVLGKKLTKIIHRTGMKFILKGVMTPDEAELAVVAGADAVMVGRPFSVAAVGGLQAGVETYIDTLMSELKQTMVLTGTSAASAVDRKILISRGG